MELLNTLVIDPADPQHQEKFINLIEDNTFIVFVVLGYDAVAKKVVERADIFADDHTGRIARKVAWAKDHEILKADCLNYLKTFPDYDETKYEQTFAFVLSPKHHECKFVFLDGDPTDDFNISKAYWKASLRERAIA